MINRMAGEVLPLSLQLRFLIGLEVEKPNNYQTFDELAYALTWDQDLTGTFYLWVRKESEKVIGLHRLDPTKIQWRTTKDKDNPQNSTVWLTFEDLNGQIVDLSSEIVIQCGGKK